MCPSRKFAPLTDAMRRKPSPTLNSLAAECGASERQIRSAHSNLSIWIERGDSLGSPPALPAGASIVSIYTHPERDRETQSDARRFAAGPLVSFFPSPIGRFHQGISNVFVESCRALGARGNGRSLPTTTPRSSRSRERRAHGEERPPSVVFHEQEVRRLRSGLAVVPHSLIS